MAIGSIGSASALTTYQLPVGPSAKAADEQSESPAVRAREASTGKDCLHALPRFRRPHSRRSDARPGGLCLRPISTIPLLRYYVS